MRNHCRILTLEGHIQMSIFYVNAYWGKTKAGSHLEDCDCMAKTDWNVMIIWIVPIRKEEN
jgi:hypothetical protein